jgi:predicted N-formylglutamate amidohydrolase
MTLLESGDPPPFTVLRAGAASPFVFICDHAGREVPRRLGDLGVKAPDMDRHIAWDIGAGVLAKRLGEHFGACTILQTYSRLVIDANRWPDAADAMPDHVDGADIPANRALPAADRAARIAEIHTPYHAAIAVELDARAARGVRSVPIFVHSFTPSLSGTPRPWRCGVLHDGSSSFARGVLQGLRAVLGDEVGDNEPYALGATDYSAPVHALARGLQYLELEVRQDLLSSDGGLDTMAALLQATFREALADLD